MDFITGNILATNQQIAHAAALAGRDAAEITLIAATKTQDAAIIEAAYAAGIRNFGENYLDEAVKKIAHLDLPDATWHFIGRIQSNKTKLIATHFDWVQTVDRIKIAKRLSEQRGETAPLNVLIQVNVDADPAKAGVLVADLPDLIQAVADLENLTLRGLMTILDPASDPATSYQSMAQLFADAKARLPHGHPWDTLSMGMSGDMAEAIAAGATHVRIGTALFGPRKK